VPALVLFLLVQLRGFGAVFVGPFMRFWCCFC
jgi:hypothetical protein